MNNAADLLSNRHVIVSCEGTGEQFVVNTLLDADRLAVSRDDVVAVTRKRSAKSVQEEFLNYDYGWPVAIARIVDSRAERFKLGALYRDRFPVLSFFTHPEIEMLIVVREGKYSDYTRKYKSKMRPNVYCSQVLGLGNVKSKGFLADYWDANLLCDAIRDYARLAKVPRGELVLADLLR